MSVSRRSEPRLKASVRQAIRPAPFRGTAIASLVRRAAGVIGARRADIRVRVVDDIEMERWNRETFGHHGATNVISFPEVEPGDPADGSPDFLGGDILVSAETCLRQTKGWPGSPEERVFWFVLHGMLHLAGHEHVGDAVRAKVMRRAETVIYDAVVGNGRSPGMGRRSVMQDAGSRR